MIKKASVNEINEMLGSGGECQVIDVREFSEFNSERIADAQRPVVVAGIMGARCLVEPPER